LFQLHQDLEEAADTGGISWATAFRYNVLPLLFPSIVAGWVFFALRLRRETTMAFMLFSPSSRVISLLMFDNLAELRYQQSSRHRCDTDGGDRCDHAVCVAMWTGAARGASRQSHFPRHAASKSLRASRRACRRSPTSSAMAIEAGP
jgi:hypothetical protein